MSSDGISGASRLARFVLAGLYFVATFLAGTGLILSAALKTDGAADRLLAWNPRYSLGIKGVQVLEDFNLNPAFEFAVLGESPPFFLA
jgi:hypothetical protein